MTRSPLSLRRAVRALRGDANAMTLGVDAVVHATLRFAELRRGACCPSAIEAEALEPSSTASERQAERERIARGMEDWRRRKAAAAATRATHTVGANDQQIQVRSAA